MPPAPAGANFELTPSNPITDQDATIVASGCPLGHEVNYGLTPEEGAIGRVTGYSDPALQSTSTSAITYHFKFPAAVVGPVTVEAVCKDSTTGAALFAYDSFHAVVTTLRHLDVSPGASVAAGTTIKINPVGPECPQPSIAQVTLEQPSATPPIEADVSNASAPSWQATIVIPTSATPGRYRVVAICVNSRSTEAVYAPAPVQVTIRGE